MLLELFNSILEIEDSTIVLSLWLLYQQQTSKNSKIHFSTTLSRRTKMPSIIRNKKHTPFSSSQHLTKQSEIELWDSRIEWRPFHFSNGWSWMWIMITNHHSSITSLKTKDLRLGNSCSYTPRCLTILMLMMIIVLPWEVMQRKFCNHYSLQLMKEMQSVKLWSKIMLKISRECSDLKIEDQERQINY